MGLTFTYSLSDFQTLLDTFAPNPANVFQDTLVLTNTFTYEVLKGFSDIQTLVDTFVPNVETTYTLSDTLVPVNVFQGYVDSPNVILTPIPSIPNQTVNTPPSTTNPNFPPLGPFNPGTVTFAPQTVGFSCVKGSLTAFKAPDFGNKDTYHTHEIVEDSRGLELIQFKDSIWGDEIAYTLNFSQLDENEKDSIRAFLWLSIGLQVTYTDIYGIAHNGFITNPDAQITSSANGYSIPVSFLEAPAAT